MSLDQFVMVHRSALAPAAAVNSSSSAAAALEAEGDNPRGPEAVARAMAHLGPRRRIPAKARAMTIGGMRSHVSGVPRSVGFPEKLTVIVSRLIDFPSPAAGVALTGFITTDFTTFLDAASWGALYSGVRCKKLEILWSITSSQASAARNDGDSGLIAFAPDPDTAASPAGLNAVISKATEVGVFRCCPNMPTAHYTYVVPDHPPYNNYIDSLTATAGSGSVQLATSAPVGAVVFGASQAIVFGTFELIERI